MRKSSTESARVNPLETPNIAARPTPILPSIVADAAIEGWLMKKGSKFPWGWNERYFAFVPSSRTLFYFNPDDAKDGVLSVRGRMFVKSVREGTPR